MVLIRFHRVCIIVQFLYNCHKMFYAALEEFLEKTRGTLEGIFNIMCVFNGMQDVFTRCVVSATETYTLMRTTAGKILNKRVRLSSRSE